ncbi:Fc.00g032200.m01.CDS01 [Cosmosporella sp. VM-42]
MPNDNKGGKKPRTHAAVPTRFRCKVGGEWKPIDAFSNSQRRFIQRQIDSRQAVNAAHSGMTCREHAAGSRAEIRCERCQLIKHIDDFSKNARRNEVYECMRCVAWTETQEPNVTPAPLETGHISVEEQNEEVWTGEFINAGDFFDENALPAAPVTELASLGIRGNGHSETLATSDSSGNLNFAELLKQTNDSTISRSTAASVSGASTISTSSTQANLPPHLRSRFNMETSSNGSAFSEALKVRARPPPPASDAGSLPPHLRRLGEAQRRKKVADSDISDTASFASGFTRGSSVVDSSEAGPRGRPGHPPLGGIDATQKPDIRSYANSLSAATTVREEKERAAKARQVSFNAWDSKGDRYRHVKEPTIASSSVSTTSTDRHTNSSPMIHGEWSTTIQVEEPKCRGNGKWPKTSESRLPQSQVVQQPRVTHVSARHVDPEIDRQRKMNYCDSDDSDY